jgi:hypothetical protein
MEHAIVTQSIRMQNEYAYMRFVVCLEMYGDSLGVDKGRTADAKRGAGVLADPDTTPVL